MSLSPDTVAKIVNLGKDAMLAGIGGRSPSKEEAVARLLDIGLEIGEDLVLAHLHTRLSARVAAEVDVEVDAAEEAKLAELETPKEDAAEAPPTE